MFVRTKFAIDDDLRGSESKYQGFWDLQYLLILSILRNLKIFIKVMKHVFWLPYIFDLTLLLNRGFSWTFQKQSTEVFYQKRCSIKKGLLKNIRKFTGNTCVEVSLLQKNTSEWLLLTFEAIFAFIDWLLWK